jgi:CBS domain-containing protein
LETHATVRNAITRRKQKPERLGSQARCELGRFPKLNRVLSRPSFTAKDPPFMEIVGTVTHLLREKDSHVWSIKPDATVYEAIELMAEKNIGAVPVVAGGKLLGILSERDYSRKVILKGKSSKKTFVREIMNERLVVVSPDDTVGECMRLMTEKRVRHLPVLENGNLIGILSIGDFVKWIISAQTATIDQLTKYIFGE